MLKKQKTTHVAGHGAQGRAGREAESELAAEGGICWVWAHALCSGGRGRSRRSRRGRPNLRETEGGKSEARGRWSRQVGPGSCRRRAQMSW
jgi:hypothetical protein